MAVADPEQITDILSTQSESEPHDLEQLVPEFYNELRLIARAKLRHNPTSSFQTTELIHEVYLKLAKTLGRGFKNKEHFFGVAAAAMRHILVDYARSKNAEKRGGLMEKISLTSEIADTSMLADQVASLDEALQVLAKLDMRKCRVVELKYFGGLTNEETAKALDVSVETVKRDWRFARSWLLRELDRSGY